MAAKKEKDEKDEKDEAGRGPDYKPDRTIKGGKYAHPDGRLKNAHGQPIDEDGTVIDGSQVPTVDIPAQEAPPTQ